MNTYLLNLSWATHLENLFNGVNVGRGSEVQAQIVFHRGLHDSLELEKKRVSWL